MNIDRFMAILLWVGAFWMCQIRASWRDSLLTVCLAAGAQWFWQRNWSLVNPGWPDQL